MTQLISRRSLALHIAAVPLGLSAAANAWGAPAGGLTRSAEAIHQEITFKATRRRVYEALTKTAQFDAVTRLSDGAELLKSAGAKPTSIGPEVGNPFVLFGGYITGRHVELIPDERLVQAWRAASWKPGEYSIVRLELLDDPTGTKLRFDHRGFPMGQGAHLADGWHTHYWDPLAKYLT